MDTYGVSDICLIWALVHPLSRSLSDIVSGCTYNDFPLQRKLGLNFLLHYCNYHL